MRKCLVLVEFIGGSLNGRIKIVERYFDLLNNNGEVYQARAIRYEKMNWTYVWYEITNYYGEMVNG